MAGFAHLLDHMLHITAPYLIAVAVILWAIAFGTAAVGVWRRGWWARPRPSPLFVWPGIGFLAIVLSLIPHNMQYGPQAALIAEAFTPRLRYSGSLLGYQLASVIAGATRPEQIEANVKAVSWKLTPAEMADVDKLAA